MNDEMMDAPEAIRLLREAVEEKGADYVYGNDACVYALGNGVQKSPSCLVGHVLHKKGWIVDPPDKHVTEVIAWNSAASELGFEHFTYGAVEVLVAAQNVQDGNMSPNRGTWGEALDEAIRIAKRDGIRTE